MKNKGVAISREKAVYEKSAEYLSKKKATGSGYPAKRPWFSFTKGGLCVEALSGIDQQYPYPARVLFTYLFNPVYSIPGGYRFKETLADTDKVPLHISLDIAINESNIYADYIVPDLSFAEGHYGWLTPHAPGLSFTGIRSPMIEPINHKTPDGRPICTETLLIDLAKSINDCLQLGLKKGDNVKLVSESNPKGIRGQVQPTALIRPGCIAVSFHFGHSQFGGSSLEVKEGDKVFMGGKSIMKGNLLITNQGFTKGLNFNDVALLDKNMNQTPMVDLVGGIPDFSSTRVKIIKET